MDELRAALQTALTTAMKARDRVATSALRTTLAAVAHAEAVPIEEAPAARAGVIAGGVQGLGAGEVARRTLNEADVRAVVDAEIADRRAQAAHFDELGRPDDAARLRAEADAIVTAASTG